MNDPYIDFVSTINNLGLIESDKSVGDSIPLGCKFWKTKYENIYLSDYDVFGSFGLDGLDLKIFGILVLFSSKKHCYISMETLQEDEFFNEELDFFYNQIISEYNFFSTPLAPDKASGAKVSSFSLNELNRSTCLIKSLY